MANITLIPGKDLNIYQLESTDDVQGGVGGIANAQALTIGNNIAALWRSILGGDATTFTTGTVPTVTAADGGKAFMCTSLSANTTINLPTFAGCSVGTILVYECLATAGTFWLKVNCSTANEIDDMGTTRTDYYLHPGEQIVFIKRAGASKWTILQNENGSHYRQAGRILLMSEAAIVAGSQWLTGIHPCIGTSYSTTASANPFPRLYAAIGTSAGSGSGTWKVPNIPSFSTGGKTFSYYIKY